MPGEYKKGLPCKQPFEFGIGKFRAGFRPASQRPLGLIAALSLAVIARKPNAKRFHEPQV
jgi:hypothetical protein